MRNSRETTPRATNRGVNSPSSPKYGGILSAGVDWLTATTTDDVVSSGWYEWFGGLAEILQRDHGPAQFCRRVGYDGMVLADNTFIGRRESAGDTIWISTGAPASRDWQVVAGPADRISRLDLQVTWAFRDGRDRNLARNAYANRDLSGLSHTYMESERGATCYVGSRKSDFFGRIYDKSHDLSLPRGSCWRYEIVCRDKPTNAATIARLQDAAADGILHEHVCSLVWWWFFSRSTTPPLFSSDRKVLVREASLSAIYPDTKLAWLRSQVAPTISRMIRDGFGDRALEALGLVQEELPFWAAGGKEA